MAGVFVLTLIAINAPALLRAHVPSEATAHRRIAADVTGRQSLDQECGVAAMHGARRRCRRHAQTDEIDRESSRGVRGRRLGHPKV